MKKGIWVRRRPICGKNYCGWYSTDCPYLRRRKGRYAIWRCKYYRKPLDHFWRRIQKRPDRLAVCKRDYPLHYIKHTGVK